MERWDAYNSDIEKLDKTLVRGEIIPEGMFHLVAEVILRHRDGSFLAMRRDISKPNSPGKYEITAGGSVLTGEIPGEAARRELLEETGIAVDNLEFLNIGVDETVHSIYYLYSAVTDCDKNSITLQEGETVSYEWVSRGEVLDFIRKDTYCKIQGRRIFPYIAYLTGAYRDCPECVIGSSVSITVDRPLGSVHPKHSDIVYPINYGYVGGIFAPDGEEQDAYILGADEPIKRFMGEVVAVIVRKNDSENKWVAAPEGMRFSEEDILSATAFQEQYFDTEIIMG